MKIAFFDTKPYDKASFDKYVRDDIIIKYYETKLNEDTVELAKASPETSRSTVRFPAIMRSVISLLS